jgi:hypothetical protein
VAQGKCWPTNSTTIVGKQLEVHKVLCVLNALVQGLQPASQGAARCSSMRSARSKTSPKSNANSSWFRGPAILCAPHALRPASCLQPPTYCTLSSTSLKCTPQQHPCPRYQGKTALVPNATSHRRKFSPKSLKGAKQTLSPVVGVVHVHEVSLQQHLHLCNLLLLHAVVTAAAGAAAA